jgi:uncharacterized protein (UPF0332 family)
MSTVLPDTAFFFAKAARAISAARTLLSAGHTDFAVSRAYYVMLYVVDGLLAARGIHIPLHEGAHAAFAEQFTDTGVLDPAWHDRLIEVFGRRLIADYQPDAEVPADEAASIIETAAGFLRAARRTLESIEPYGG